MNIYPLKSARGIPLSAAGCGLSGLLGDRYAMIAGLDGSFITQRQMPKLAQITVTPQRDGLLLSMAGKTDLLATPQIDQRFDVTIWKDTVSAAKASAETNSILSDWLGQPVHLTFFDDRSERTASRDWVNSETPISFSDGFQLLVTTSASLAALNANLTAHGDETVSMERFRPNIVIDCEEAWAEDQWLGIEVAGVNFDFVKPCVRCIMTTQDQKTGSRDIATPMPAMGRLRMSADRRIPGPIFGWNAVPNGKCVLQVGDDVTITGMRSQPWPVKIRN